MKRLPLVLVLVSAISMAACSSMTAATGKAKPASAAGKVAPTVAAGTETAADRVSIHDANGSAEVWKVKFRVGVSSATVEHLGRRFGCVGKAGAGLITEKGPVEVYRMECDNGTTFMAECELRQCRPLR